MAGASLLGGVLIGEGVYSLTVIADSTSPVYWCIQITVALIAEGVIGWLRRWPTRALLLATGLTATVAVAFRFGYATVGALPKAIGVRRGR